MNLTAEQLATFKEKFANVIVNNMTLKECQELIFNQICNEFDDMSFNEIVENTLKEDMHVIDELVKEVTSNDINMKVQL